MRGTCLQTKTGVKNGVTNLFQRKHVHLKHVSVIVWTHYSNRPVTGWLRKSDKGSKIWIWAKISVFAPLFSILMYLTYTYRELEILCPRLQNSKMTKTSMYHQLGKGNSMQRLGYVLHEHLGCTRVFLFNKLFSDKTDVELEKGQHLNEGTIFPFVSLKYPMKPERMTNITDTQIHIKCTIKNIRIVCFQCW